MTRTDKSIIRKVAERTANNEHTEALVIVARWCANFARAKCDVKLAVTANAALQKFEAIRTVHEGIGNLPYDVYVYRYKVSAELLEELNRADPEAARLFTKAL